MSYPTHNDPTVVPLSRPWITEDDKMAVNAVLDSGDLMSGKHVQAFEEELAGFLGRKHVVCTNSGSAAIQLAVRAYAVPGDVSGPLPAFGFVATPNAWLMAGVEFDPLFMDGSAKFLLGEEDQGPGVLGALAMGSRGGSLTIRDACQAFGTKLPYSEVDCYSFNANKPISCIGGCAATDDRETAHRITSMRDQGRSASSGRAKFLGGNFKMPEMNAALGRSQLRRVRDILHLRKMVASWYSLDLPEAIARPAGRDSWFMYPIEVEDRDRVKRELAEKGVETRDCSDWLLPAHPYFMQRYGHDYANKQGVYKKGQFPEAERRAARTLLLPCYPTMNLQLVQVVCNALEEAGAKS